jgi:hypothetical protein
MTLADNVQRELGISFLEETTTHTYRFKTKSTSSDKLYVVSMRKKTMRWECGCQGWIRHRKCRHLDALLPTLAQLSGMIATTDNVSETWWSAWLRDG